MPLDIIDGNVITGLDYFDISNCKQHDRQIVMNISERPPMPGPEAALDFGHGEFRVVRPGAFVRCAVTGAPIRLDELRYWSVDWQEAYVSPEAVQLRLRRAGRA
jgi:hypothetical protein